MMAIQIAGAIAATLVSSVILFQIALVLGAPWGAAAWGGQSPGRLPTRLRVASLVAALLLAFIAWVVAAAAGLASASPLPQSWLGPATWIATGYFGIGTIANLISRSPVERWWAPVALATAVCCGIVATG